MKNLLSLSLLAALVTADNGFAVETAPEAPRVAFRTQAVKRGSVVATVQATGTIEPEEVVDVGSQVAGTVLKFGPDAQDATKAIDIGSQVEAGAVLAQLDDAVYRSLCEHARAKQERARAVQKLNEARLVHKERDWHRAEQLRTRGAVSEEETESARSAYEIAKAEVEVGKPELLQIDAEVKLAEINLNFTTIRSPIKGVVLDRRINIGQSVTPGLNAPSLFLIARDLTRMQVWASVNEEDIARVHPGQQVRFTVAAFPGQQFVGQVTQVRLNATAVDKAVTYMVVITTDNAHGKLLPYLTAKVRIAVAEKKDALLVPRAALVWQPRAEWQVPAERGNGVSALKELREETSRRVENEAKSERGLVWIEEKGRVRPIEVRVGLNDGTWTEIVEGDLHEGQAVVVGASPAAK